MENFTISDFNFFLFAIPGFLMVWCFRKFTHKEIKSDFELVGLSIFWGLVNLALWEFFSGTKIVNETLKNIYVAALVLCLVGVLFSYIGSWIALQKWWLAVKVCLKSRPVRFIKFIREKLQI
jgi:hypothetical protein